MLSSSEFDEDEDEDACLLIRSRAVVVPVDLLPFVGTAMFQLWMLCWEEIVAASNGCLWLLKDHGSVDTDAYIDMEVVAVKRCVKRWIILPMESPYENMESVGRNMVEDGGFKGSVGSDVLHHVHVMYEQNLEKILWPGVWWAGLQAVGCGQAGLDS
eukprot:3657672-Ditylum_brightwellii.AAC.1